MYVLASVFDYAVILYLTSMLEVYTIKGTNLDLWLGNGYVSTSIV